MRGRSNGAIEYGSLPKILRCRRLAALRVASWGSRKERRPVGRVAPRPPNVRSAIALIILLVACSNRRSRSETPYRLAVSLNPLQLGDLGDI